MRLQALSLSEVIIAVALCSMAVFALVSLQLASLRWKTQSSLQQRAALLASSVLDDKVSRLRINFADPSLQESQHPVTNTPFRQMVEISQEGPESPPVLKRVEVTLYWHGRQGEQTYKLVTRVYRE